MINQNGTLCKAEEIDFTIDNRAFKYGDSVFETIKVVAHKILFLEDHYFRLMASMHLLRMEVPMHFDLEFFEEQILLTVKANDLNHYARVRVTMYRKVGGLYTPKTNDIDYLIEASTLNLKEKNDYTLDLYKDHYVNSGLLSTIKTNNRIINVLGSIFASENGFDNCILLNEQKHVVEVLNGNIFLIKDNHIKTPKLLDGCINGIVRKKVITLIQKSDVFTIEETSISPFEIQKSDEVFITNSIIGIQSIARYKKKFFTNLYSIELKKQLIDFN